MKVDINTSMTVSANGYVEGYAYFSSTTIPISGVTVNIDEQYYTTNSNGYYRLDNIITGAKIMKATKDGYDPFTKNINVIQNKNTINVDMTSALFTFNVFGTILCDQTNLPIKDVLVEILNPDGNPSLLKTLSDVNGYYQIPSVPQGTRKIRFSNYQHDTQEAEIYLSNTNYKYDVRLSISVFEICGNINKDWNFYLYNSPYYIGCNTTFLSGYTLNIEPGVKILFKGNYKLTGKIIAEGSQSLPIYFTSIDTLTPIRWNSIELKNNSKFNYVKQSFASDGVIVNSNNGSINLSSSQFYNNTNSGISVFSSFNSIKTCTVSNSNKGYYFKNVNNSKIDNCISENNQAGVYLESSSNISIIGSKIRYSSKALDGVNSSIDSIYNSTFEHLITSNIFMNHSINLISHSVFNDCENGYYYFNYPPKRMEYCSSNESIMIYTSIHVITSFYTTFSLYKCDFYRFSAGSPISSAPPGTFTYGHL